MAENEEKVVNDDETSKTVRELAEEIDVPGSGARRRQLKLWACLVGFVYAIYAFFTANQRGNAIFTLIISGFALLSVWPEPGNVVRDFGEPPRLMLRRIRDFSLKEFLIASGEVLRSGYRVSDGLVRLLLLMISVGGTAVVMKYGIRNFFLPDSIDIWVKRFGPAFAILVMVLFPTYLISKRIFLLAMNDRDTTCRKYELSFYLSVTLLCLTILAFFLGLPVETFIPSHRPNGPPPMWSYNSTWTRYLGSFCLIWSIWAIGFGGCILSRFFEVSWRDAPFRQ